MSRIPVPPNFGVVLPARLFRSATPTVLPSPGRMALARGLGLRCVVNLAAEEPDLTWPAGCWMVRLPIDKFLRRDDWPRIQRLLDEPRNFPMLAHCHAGAERTGSFVAAALVYMGYPIEQAMSETIAFGLGLWSEAELAVLHAQLRDLAARRTLPSDRALRALQDVARERYGP